MRTGHGMMDAISAQGDDVLPNWFDDRIPADLIHVRPWITLTYAQSLDGCIASLPGVQHRLSGRRAMRETHRLRAFHDAILVGIGTVVADDPRLTVRLVRGRHPRPVVLDSHLRLPLGARLFRQQNGPIIVATTRSAAPDREQALRSAGAEVVRLDATADGEVSIPAVCEALARRGIRRLMVEGGARVLSSFLSSRLGDHLFLTIAPCAIGDGVRPIDLAHPLGTAPMPTLRETVCRCMGSDLIVSGRLLWE